jgi:hypothetical protein
MYKLNKKINKEKFINDFEKFCPGHKYIPAILPAAERVIAIGDIHGDYNLAIKLLKIGKVIDNNLNWIGGKTFVVQVGDQIDRCRPVNGFMCTIREATIEDEASDIKILELFTNLHKKAQEHGGAVISLLGNHELLNTVGQLHYVSYKGLHQFDRYKDPFNPNASFRSGEDARKYAFSPGKEYAKYLACTRLGSVVIGSNLFVHAGIVDGLLDELNINKEADIEIINIAISKWLLGMLKQKYINKIINASEHSMFWTRILGYLPPDLKPNDKMCQNNLSRVLKLFKINGMIVGHTPQSFYSSDGINSTCGNIRRVDNGSSAAFHNFDPEYMNTGKITHARRPQVLEILNDKIYNVLE